MIKNITQKIHNIKRLRNIAQVVSKYGFGYIIERLNIDKSLIGGKIAKFKSVEKFHISDMPVPVRVRKICEELGTTFIKIGQIVSTRPDIFPLEFCVELEKLQDEVPFVEYEKIKNQIISELDIQVDDKFVNFSHEPIASASLSQVHSAELKTGEKVAVKIQRPGIKNTILSDLEILSFLANLADKYFEESRSYNFPKIAREFRKSILRELDFTIEANNADRFSRNFKDDETVYVPSIIKDLSTSKILTITVVDGIKIINTDEIEKAGLDRKQIAVNGAKAVLKQVFKDGFFHADLHPGNIFALENNKVAFIDFGMTGFIDDRTKFYLVRLLSSIVDKDIPEIIEVFIEMGAADEADLKKLNEDLTDFLARYYDVSLKELNMKSLLGDLLDIISQDGIRIPPDLFLLIKTLVTFEGIGKKLDPDFNMAIHAESFIEDLIHQKYSPARIAKELKKFSRRFYNLAYALPKDISFILGKMKKGHFRVEFEHKGLENLIHVLDKVSNRISFSVIIAALIVGSSIIMQSDKGLMLFGFPILGIIGFVLAAIMGLWLAISILRSGKL
ncbi:MAG: AarF/UbiB family protein [Elusimicrobiota bacterium]|nr:AarF/UbiB family protein [Elusimicrobiota bacterium]